jgi:hypothetical protein
VQIYFGQLLVIVFPGRGHAIASAPRLFRRAGEKRTWLDRRGDFSPRYSSLVTYSPMAVEYRSEQLSRERTYMRSRKLLRSRWITETNLGKQWIIIT